MLTSPFSKDELLEEFDEEGLKVAKAKLVNLEFEHIGKTSFVEILLKNNFEDKVKEEFFSVR